MPVPFEPNMEEASDLEPLAFESGRQVAGCVSSHLPSLLLLPGSLRPVQVTVFGFIFCWAWPSPGRGGVGREGGRKEQLCQHNPWRLCSCPFGLTATLY